MTRFNALLHRYRHTLVVVSILLPMAVAALQTARLQYLEDRHHRMLMDFSANQLRMQMDNADLARRASACRTD
jgi:hypothetical protein